MCTDFGLAYQASQHWHVWGDLLFNKLQAHSEVESALLLIVTLHWLGALLL